MRISRDSESSGRPLSTADLAAAGRPRDVTDEDERVADAEVERRTSSADESNTTRRKEPSGDRTLGRPATDEELRTSQIEADIGTPRAGITETARRSVNAPRSGEEALVALFTPEMSETYRSRWISIQSSFVDDPKQAVRNGDELVAQIMTNLANSFAEERHRVEAQLDRTGEGSTENLRVALRRYRSFFERLLSL
jgi:hypothetical protein